ncbi:LADA_0C10044g1_1 [Lachancea dasiensis]|uniref:LADA_0C10044g1_1 n=1 Tax=Lachancea dasiensis TaxID=1072105 RepID=A0A1G4J106_9SACH|nr:LADA_0C10044g1_1 [Lachancea dasiensis]
MGRSLAIALGVKQIPNIIPVDRDSAKQLCEQVLQSHGEEPEKIAEKFLEILGSEDISLNFVLQFNEQLNLKEPSEPSAIKADSVSSSKNSHSTLTAGSLEPLKNKKPVSTSVAKPGKVAGSSSLPLKSKPNPKTAQAVQEKPSKNARQRKLQNLHEIDDVLKVLELESTESDSKNYKCNCQGRRHPLFEIAPNCLSCGKIICAREGLHLSECSFCGAELMTLEERTSIIDVLKQEREDLKSSHSPVAVERPKKSKSFKISSGTGTNLFSEQDRLFERLEKEKQRELKRKEVLDGIGETQKQNPTAADDDEEDKELRNAQDRLERLLHFQDTSAQRTKIIDNASDFSMSNDSNIWGNAQDRALMLKKQQRNVRRWEKLEQERRGRRDKVVMDLVIGKDGKVIMREATRVPKTAHAADDEDVEDISDEEDAKDLRDIAGLSDSLSQSKKDEEDLLASNIWDSEKDRKQLKKPVYVGFSGDEIANSRYTNEQSMGNRVQISQDSENSLEQNILAVL